MLALLVVTVDTIVVDTIELLDRVAETEFADDERHSSIRRRDLQSRDEEVLAARYDDSIHSLDGIFYEEGASEDSCRKRQEELKKTDCKEQPKIVQMVLQKWTAGTARAWLYSRTRPETTTTSTCNILLNGIYDRSIKKCMPTSSRLNKARPELYLLAYPVYMHFGHLLNTHFEMAPFNYFWAQLLLFANRIEIRMGEEAAERGCCGE